MNNIDKKQEYHNEEEWLDNVQKLKEYNKIKEKVEYLAKQKNDNNPIINGSYEIVYDEEIGWCVDIDGDVNFGSDEDLYEFEFRFRNVTGNFWCNNSNLLGLIWGPKYVGKDFSCSCCFNLSSLEDCPKEVGGDFSCSYCEEEFSESYIQSLCFVHGNIYNYNE